MTEDMPKEITTEPKLPAVRPEPTNLPTLPTMQGLRVCFRLAEIAKRAGIAPDSETLGGTMYRIVSGLEMGMGPWQALRMLFTVPGRRGRGSGLGMLTVVRIAQFHQAGHRYEEISNDGQTCVLTFFLNRPTGRWTERVELPREYCDQRGWTKTASGQTKDNWADDPAGMLFYRTFCYGFRRFTPECEFIRLNPQAQPFVMTEDDMNFLGELEQNQPEVYDDFLEAQRAVQEVAEIQDGELPDQEPTEGAEEEEPPGEAPPEEEPLEEGAPKAERLAPQWTGTEKRDQLLHHARAELELSDEDFCQALGLDSVDDLWRYPASYRISMALLDDYWELKQRTEEEVEELDQGHPPKKEGKAPTNGKLL